MKWITFFLFIFCHVACLAQNERGRVQIQNGTLLTDTGSLLRGAFVSLDSPSYSMCTREEIAAVKELGLNTIHVYAENYWDEKQNGPGYNSNDMDNLVAWTAEESLYLIITMTGVDFSNQENIQFAKDCWSFYAKRYKNETHLIFEILNEPADVPFEDEVINFEKEVYQIIRSNAPDTHIQLLSPWNIFYPELLNDIQRLEPIDWNNASIAGHVYHKTGYDYIESIKRIKNAGYTLMITEFHSIENKYANLAYIRLFEDLGISYANFINLTELVNNNSVYKSMVESSEIRWIPDFGTWPQSLTDIDYVDPFIYHKAGFYDEGSNWRPSVEISSIEYVEPDSYVGYYNLNFETAPIGFDVFCSSDNGGGTIEIRLDSLTGPLLGECIIQNTGNWNNYQKFSCDIETSFEGIHNIFLIFRSSDNNYQFNVKAWVFLKEETNSDQSPYNDTPFSLPGKIEAEDYDNGGYQISFFDTDTINSNIDFRTGGVDFDPTYDGGYKIGWNEIGEWLEYSVNCEQDMLMNITFRASCVNAGEKLRLTMNGTEIATVYFPDTGGWGVMENITIEGVQIFAGQNKVLRIETLQPSYTLDWILFEEDL